MPAAIDERPSDPVARRRRAELFAVAGFAAEAADPAEAALASRMRRLRGQVLLEWAALAVLLLVPAAGDPAATSPLAIDGTMRSVFSLGVVVVAAHSGLRLGDLLAARRLARALDDGA